MVNWVGLLIEWGFTTQERRKTRKEKNTETNVCEFVHANTRWCVCVHVHTRPGREIQRHLFSLYTISFVIRCLRAMFIAVSLRTFFQNSLMNNNSRL